MSGNGPRAHTARFECTERRDARRQQSGLGEFRQIQAIGRTVEAQPGHVIPHEGGGLFVDLPGGGTCIIKAPPHPDRLRPLAGEDHSYVRYHIWLDMRKKRFNVNGKKVSWKHEVTSKQDGATAQGAADSGRSR